jgi:NAD(P)-dependent dehydrogenase (short-subunit alcohol dehydrogenase family)
VNARDDVAIADTLTCAGADHIVLSTGWPLFVRARDFDVAAAMDWVGDRVEPILGIAKWIARNSGRTRSLTIVSGFVHRRPEPGLALWSLMGPGIVGLAENLAVDLAPTRVNVVGPGPMVDSEMLKRAVGSDDAHRKLVETMRARNPAGRAVRLEDTARQVLFVVGDPIVAGSFREVEGGGNLTAGMGFVHD